MHMDVYGIVTEKIVGLLEQGGSHGRQPRPTERLQAHLVGQPKRGRIMPVAHMALLLEVPNRSRFLPSVESIAKSPYHNGKGNHAMLLYLGS
jgi:hypothetical protein